MTNIVFRFVACTSTLLFPVLLVANDGATVRGKVAQAANKKFQIELSKIPVTLRQMVKIPPPPYPDKWQTMTIEQRQKWIEQFQQSDAGKNYIEQNENKLAAAASFEIKIESDGNFVVFDVPAGDYGLRGRLDREIDGINHAFEIFGQVSVVKDVDELLLEPLRILVTPLLKFGDQAPQFSIAKMNANGDWQPKDFSGKFLLIQFWSQEYSPPSVQVQANVQEMFAALSGKHKMELLSVCMDQNKKAAAEFVRSKKLSGQHAVTGGWQHSAIDAYGVRSIPCFWLIDPEGKIKMTNAEINRAINDPKLDLIAMVENRILGNDTPTIADEPEKTTKDK